MPDGASRVPEFEPKLVTVLREGYTRRQFGRDLFAGLIVAVIAVPLAIAFGIASGVKPEQGLVTAVVAGFLISALGGSRVQIGGPTGAFIVLVAGIVHEHGYEGLALATLMAGGLLIVMGLARLGVLIQFIPYPVTLGFTAGIALIIATGQVGELAGLTLPAVPGEFLQKWAVYAEHAGSAQPWALALGLGSVVFIAAWRRLVSRVPGPLVVLLLTTAAVQLFDLPVETIGSRFGEVSGALPMPRLPDLDLGRMRALVSPAVAIALLAGIESLLSAVVADGMTGRRHRSNMELVAQGVANVASPLFGGIPATGAIARTAANVKNGGGTPVAGMVHAAALLVILLAAGRWVALVPLCTLAGILMVVAFDMSEWRLFAKQFRSTRSDTLVMLSTFGLTVLVDLVVALQVGMVLAALLFIRRMAQVTEVRDLAGLLDESEPDDPEAVSRFDIPTGVEVFEIQGTFFFGAAHKFRATLARIERKPRVLILRMRHVPAMDATGLHALEELAVQCRRQGTALVLSGVKRQPSELLERSGLAAQLGEAQVCAGFGEAVERARTLARVETPA